MSYQETSLGVDRHLCVLQLLACSDSSCASAINHVAHVILTSHLLPLLKKTASQGNIVRIVNQASNAHENAPKDTKFASLDEINQDLGPMALYGRSKSVMR